MADSKLLSKNCGFVHNRSYKEKYDERYRSFMKDLSPKDEFIFLSELLKRYPHLPELRGKFYTHLIN